MATIELISTNSNYRQGISFCTERVIEAGDGAVGEEHIFWEELWTKMNTYVIAMIGNGMKTLTISYLELRS